MASHELTIMLSDSTFEEIKRYKKLLHKKSTADAITELIKYALTLPPYFKDFDWKKAETEADKEIAAGKTKSFKSADDLLSDLKK
jgi:predicted CopG family antitoxin